MKGLGEIAALLFRGLEEVRSVLGMLMNRYRWSLMEIERLTADDKQSLLHYLIMEGGLAPDMIYRGGSRRGYTKWPGTNEGAGDDPFPLSAIIRSGFGSMFAS